MSFAAPEAKRLAPLLAALAMLGPFSIDTFFPAFPAMQAQWQVSATALQQIISVYLAAYAVMSLLHGPLSDAFGRRRVILISTAVFVLASLGCALSPNYPVMLVFRALQGFAAGAGLIVGRAMIRDRFHGADAQRLMAQISLIFGVAPAIAPVVGGWLLLLAGWRSIFMAVMVFALLVWLWCCWSLPETLALEQRQPLSVKSLGKTYRRMLQDRIFVALSLATAANFGGLFVYIAAAPQFVLEHLRLGEQDFAWLFVPAIGGMMLGAVCSGRMAGRLSPVQTLQWAYVLMALGALGNLAVGVLWPVSLPWAVLPIAVASVGMALAFPTITLLVLDRYPQQRGAASSLQSTFVLLSNAVLAGVTVPLISGTVAALAIYASLSLLLGYAAWTFARHRLYGVKSSAVATS